MNKKTVFLWTFLPVLALLALGASTIGTGLPRWTTFTFNINTNSTAASFRAALGFTTTNVTFLTNGNFNTAQFDTGGNNLNIKAGAFVTNLVGVQLSNTVGAQVSGTILTNYVWPSGTDNDGSLITTALSTAPNVVLMPGTYTVTNRTGILGRTNGTLSSAGGPWSLNIINKNTNGLMGVSLVEGFAADGLQVTNFYPNFCQACIGLHNTGATASGPIGNNWKIRNCVTYGDCDNLHFVLTNSSSGGLIENCLAYGKDDVVACSFNGAFTFRFTTRTSNFQPTGAPTDGLRQNAISLSCNGGGKVFYADYGSTFYSSNGTGAGSATVAMIGDAGTSEVHGTFNNSIILAPAGSNSFFAAAPSSIVLNNCTYDTAQFNSLTDTSKGDGTYQFNISGAMGTNVVSGPPDLVGFTSTKYTITTFFGDEFDPAQQDFVFDGSDGSISVPATNSGALGTIKGWIPFKANGVSYHVPVYQ